MSWLIVPFAITTALLIFEALYLIIEHVDQGIARRLGVLNVTVAVVTAILFAFAYSGRLVFSPEFGLLMVETELLRIALQVLVGGIAVVASLAWNVTHQSLGLRPRLALLAAGVAVGVWAATRFQILNENDSAAPLISAYDLWWPPLLIALAIGAADGALLCAGVRDRGIRTLAGLGGIATVALLATRRPTFADPQSASWTWVLLVALLLVLMRIVWRTAPALVRRPALLLWLRVGIVCLLATVAIASVFPAVREVSMPTIMSAWVWLPSLGLAGLQVMAAALAAVRARDPAPHSGLSARRWLCAASGAFLVLILWLTTDLLPFPGAIAIVVVSAAWLLISDVLVRGPISSPVQTPAGRFSFAPYLRPQMLAAGAAGLAPYALRLLQAAGGLLSVSSWPMALIKTLAAIVVLVAVSEVVNAGKSIIQPFAVSTSASAAKDEAKAKDAATADVGRAISDRVVNTIGLLTQEMKADVLFVPQGPRRTAQIVSGAGTASIDAALAKSNDIELFNNVKLPLGLLVAPVQIPVRAVLGVQLVTGVVQIHEGRYLLLAGSTGGDSWRVESKASTPMDAVAELGDELAFKIIRSVDPSLRAAGMTTSWDAFKAFRAGLQRWRQRETDQDPSALAGIIAAFRDATHKDTTFALAHYWLGLAFQADLQTGAAPEAFRRSILANPDFTAGYLALAVALMDTYRAYPAPVDATDDDDWLKEVAARRAEARWRLHQFISFPSHTVATQRDRAVAYAALCRDARQAAEDSPNLSLTQYYVAYFYCMRGKHAYHRLDVTDRSDPKGREAEADIENELGNTVYGFMRTESDDLTDRWYCQANVAVADSITPDGKVGRHSVSRSPHMPTSVKYYARAFALVSENVIYRCNHAMAAYSTGRPDLMTALENDAKAHRTAGGIYRDRARTDPVFYPVALREFERATTMNPVDRSALNSYAYTFWQWRLWYSDVDGDGPRATAEMGRWAEAAARKAVALAVGRTTKRDEATARSTLGEVLLALSRPEEAIEHLEQVLAGAPEHDSFYDEIRWDLAQAYMCASFNDEMAKRPGNQVKARRVKAAEQLDKIRKNEDTRAVRVFTRYPELLEPGRYRFVCTRDPKRLLEARPVTKIRYALDPARTAYTPYPVCNWLGVVADVLDRDGRPGAPPGLKLHVWGGGVDQLVTVADDDAAFLSDRPRALQDYYFAQLEELKDGARLAASPVYPIRTFANEANGACPRNHIRLVFREVR